MAADSLPKYMHPHSSARIIDNAVLTVSSSGLTNMFIALEAEKGMPNEATYITTQSEWIFNFGEPNYSKYGQGALNALNYINAGGGAWVIRVVPDDERFASLSLGIGFRKDQAFTNDQEKYRRLEMTSEQIKIWNAAQTDENQKIAIDKKSGNFAIMPLFYIEENGSINTALKLQTMDEIELYKLKNKDASKVINAVAKKNVVTYSNPYIEVSGVFDLGLENAIPTKKHKANPAQPEFTEDEPIENVAFSNPTNETCDAYIRIDKYFVTNGAGEAIIENGRIATFDYYDMAKTKAAAYIDDSTDEEEEEDKPEDHIFAYSATIRIYANAASAEGEYGQIIFDVLSNLFGAVVGAEAQTFIKELNGKASFADGIYNGNKHTTKWLQDNRNEFSNARTVFKKVRPESFFGGVESEGHVSRINTKILLNIGTPDSSTWSYSFEVYKEGLEGQFIPVQAALIDNNTAFTEVELLEWNALHDLDYRLGGKADEEFPDEYVIGEGQINLVNREATTGATKNSVLYYVKYITSNEPVYSTSITMAEAYRFNRVKANSEDEVCSLSSEATFAPTSMNTKYASLLNTKAAFSADVSTDIHWQIDQGSIEDVLTRVEAIEYVNFFYNTPGLISLEAHTSGGEELVDVTIDTSAVITESAYNSIKDTSLGNLFEKVSAGVEDDEGDELTDENSEAITNEDYEEGTVTYTLRKNIEASELPFSFVSKVLVGGCLQPVTINNIPVTKTLSLLIKGRESGKAELDTARPDGNAYGDPYYFEFANATVLLSGIDSLTGFNGTFALHFVSDSIENLALKAYDIAVMDEATSITASQIPGEKVAYVRFYDNFDGSIFEPNYDYIERVYDTVGLVTTTFTSYELEEKVYSPYTIIDGIKIKNTEVWNNIDEAKEGYVIGAARDEITDVDIQEMKLDKTCVAEFCRFLPKGSGKWYNRLGVSLSYDDNYDGTYPDWSMFKLTIFERSNGEEISREQFAVALDPDAVSATKESLFIEDVVNTYSSYLTCVVNYDNLQNFVETKLAVKDDAGKVVEDEDGNEILVKVDTVIKYIFNRIDLDDFNKRTFGDDYQTNEYSKYAFTSLMSVTGVDEEGCAFDTSRYNSDSLYEYTEPFNSFWIFNTVSAAASLYLGGGSYGNGWEHAYEDEEGNPQYTSSLTQALVRAYSGVTDPFITNTNLCEFDLMFDANYDTDVRTAMTKLASETRQDCIVLLDQGLSIANATQAIDKRKNEENFDTFYAALFTQHLVVSDVWSGKVIKVTPTFFLASKIPSNDTANGKTMNFVGPRRGTIGGFRSISYMPTAYEMSELYKNQVNYIERDALGVFFATELTTQVKNTPLTLIHAVRAILSLKRDFLKISRNYRSEYATGAVQANLMGELNACAAEYILQGAFKYITPKIASTDYDVQQRICRIDVSVAFVDIMERFVFSFVVER